MPAPPAPPRPDPGPAAPFPFPWRGAGALLCGLLAGLLGLLSPPTFESAGLDRPGLAARFVADSTAAVACSNRGAGDSARALVAPLVGAARALGDSAMVARGLLVGASLDLRGSRALDAEAKVLVAQRLAIAARDTGVWMRSLRYEAMSRNLRGDLAASDRIAARWQGLAEATGHFSEQAWARDLVAWLADKRGDGATARAQLAWAEARFEELKELPGLGFTRNEKGRLLLAEGKYDSARTMFDSVLDLGQRTGDPRMIDWALGNLAVIETRIGDPVRALALTEQTLEGHRARGEQDNYLVAASNLSQFAYQLGRLDRAMEFARDGLALAERESLAGEIPWQRMSLADAMWAAGKRDSARVLWRLNLDDESAEPQVRALTAGSVARAWAEDDSVAAAAALVESSLARWGATMEQEGRVQLEILRADLDLRLGRPDRVRPRLLATAQKLDASGDRELGLAAWMRIARADRLTGALDGAAAARAHALDLWEAGRANASSLEYRELRGEQGQLLLTETLLAASTPEAAFTALQRFKTRALLERLAPPGRPGPAAGEPLAAAEFDATRFRREVLGEGELLLEYACSPDTTFLFAVSRDGLRQFGLPGARVLAPQVDLARAAFSERPSGGDATAARMAAAALGRSLLGEVADEVMAHSGVVIAPDGMLHRVPFAALLAHGSEAPLIAGRRVTITPSAQFLARLRAAPPRPPAGALLAVSGGAGPEGTLRGARAEVERLDERFAGIETRFAGNDGRLALAVSDLAGHRALHFAGHSAADDQLPWRSGIVLGRGTVGDSLLTAAEIATAPLGAGLVVLSSCESAGGRARSGEGVSGLASAFLLAGAPAVVATLWPVDDRATGDLMEQFYREMAAGRPAGDALRAAQLALRARAATAHPFFWAGFVLIGDGRVTLPLQTRALTAERAGVGIALALVGLVLALAFASRLRALFGRRGGPAAGIGLVLLGAGVLAAPRAAPAAPVTAYAPAESAAVARASWAALRRARAEGDFAAALAHGRRAHAAWPGQWVYAYGFASMGARAGDPAAVAAGLRALAAMGAGPDLAPDSALVAAARSPEGIRSGAAAALARIEANARPEPRGAVVFRFPEADSVFWPEGLAWDAAGRRFLLADVRGGRVAAVDETGRVREFARVSGGPGWSALAVAVDPRDRLVWVTAAALPQAAGYAVADSGKAAILAFDARTGALRARHDLPPAPEGHVPGDVQVAANGDVHVSDSTHPALWRIPRGGTLEEFVADPSFRSLQGQALSEDGRTLYVADYAHGLAAIDVDTRAVRWLPAPDSVSTLGLDGLARVGRDLVAVQNGIVPPRVVRIRLAGAGAAVRVSAVEEIDRDPGRADEPTLLTVRGDGIVYVANSHWEKYDEAGARRAGTVLESPLGLGLPVPPRPER